jgi:hypothetical protein
MARARAKARIPSVQIYDGDWHALSHFTHDECCECGAVHRVEFKLDNGRVFGRYTLDRQATAAARAAAGITVKRRKA